MWRRIVAAVVLCIPGVLLLAAGRKQLPTGFFDVKEIRFDEDPGEKFDPPQIPKSWRLVTVSNGEKLNTNNLWFEDRDGTIYMVNGFYSAGHFVMGPSIHKLTRMP